MIVWLFNPYGPTPDEEWRPYRYSILGNALADAGHTVVWWTSSFSHHFKKQRVDDWVDRPVCSGFTVRFVPSPAYSRNAGLGRIFRDLVYSVRAFQRASKMSPPDIVVSSESPLTFGFAGSRLAKRAKVPLVCDVMDLWPELFAIALPPWLRPYEKILFSPLYRSRRAHLRSAAGVVTLCEEYLAVAERERTQGVTLAPSILAYNGIDVRTFRSYLPPRRQPAPGVATRVIFAGSLGPNYDIPAVLDAAERTTAVENCSSLRFVIAGDGPYRTAVENAAARGWCEYLGVLSTKELAAAYASADIALCAYAPGSNVGMPDKFYDYLAAGLPIANSLTGEVRSLIERHDIGRNYAAGNPDSLLEVLKEMMATPNKLRGMAERAWSLAEEFDQARQFAKYVQLLEGIAAAARKS